MHETRGFRASLLIVTLLAASAALGCGNASSGFHSPGSTDAGAPDVGAPDAALHLVDASDGGADSGPVYACSNDMQTVVNAKGKVVATCPPDQGCAGGKCIAACDAAAANKGTLGCDFLVATPSFNPVVLPPCFAVFVTNSWTKPVRIQVSRAGTTYDVTTFGVIAATGMPETSWAHVDPSGVPPGQVAVLFMSEDPKSQLLSIGDPLTCPIPPAVSQAGGTAIWTGKTDATGTGDAWHIVTDVPVTAYDILPYGGAKSFLPSAELLIPTTAWTTNYYGIVPLRGDAKASGPLPFPGAQWGQIVAAEDGTVVKVVPNVTLPAGNGVAYAPAGKLTTYTLNAGQVIQWQDSNEMSSTVLSSNKPIGFSGGLGYDCYQSATSTAGGCDSAHQQIPPITALGYDYVAPPFATRLASMAPESIPYRVVGAVDGTVLSYDPPGVAATASALYGAAPHTLAAGQVVEFETTLAFRVKSQDSDHPFYVGQIMPGCKVTGYPSAVRPTCKGAGPACCPGDEEFVNILPPAQFLKKYVFFTDTTYATTNLVFTRTKGAKGFADVTLDCAGALTGWQPVGSEGLYEVTNVDLVRASTPNGSCNNGPHTASSDAPFGLMVWGLDSAASYAYPAGGNVGPINKVIVYPPVK